MSYMTVKFLDKEYSIPEDVLVYIELLEFTDSVQKQLANAFVRKLRNEIQKGNLGLLGDEDLTAEIEQQVGKFIAKLCDKGIFTRTISDYLKDNKGYQLYSDVNKAALEKMRTLLIQEMDAWQAGYETAVNKAESHVTGMGFSIWSSSFVNHAIYAAMEASTLNKQGKEAEAQYQKDMNDLRSRLDSQYGGEKSRYINNTYIPNMEAALTVFAYELLDKYIADLIANGKFDSKTLDYVDISRSNDLLKNLTLSHNKTAILESAFVACPFNTAVYVHAIKQEMLDEDTFETANVFKQGSKIISFLKESMGAADYPNFAEPNYYSASLLARYTNKNANDILYQHTSSYANAVIREYGKIVKALDSSNLCRDYLRKLSDDEILSGEGTSKRLANSLIYSIAPNNTWNILVNQCGHTDLFERLQAIMPTGLSIGSKVDCDSHLAKALFGALETARKDLVQSINVKRNRAKEERQKAEKAQQKKKIKTTVVCCIVAVAIIFAISLPSIIESSKKANRESAIETRIQEVTTALEQRIESQIDDDVVISFSYKEFMGYDTSLMWSFEVKMTKFEEFRKAGGQDEALLREIMSNCEIIEDIIEDEEDSFGFTVEIGDERIDINNYDGSVSYGDLSSYETFYFDVRHYTDHIDRHLYSMDTEYVVVEEK